MLTDRCSPAAQRRRTRERLDAESGVTLVELVITVAIVGVAVTAIVWGMITSITVSALHREQATADTLLRDAAEAVVDVQQSYHNCAGSGSYSLSSLSVPSGYSVAISGIQYWQKDNPATFTSSCPSPDPGMQLVTIVARSTDGQATETLSVVKRKA